MKDGRLKTGAGMIALILGILTLSVALFFFMGEPPSEMPDIRANTNTRARLSKIEVEAAPLNDPTDDKKVGHDGAQNDNSINQPIPHQQWLITLQFRSLGETAPLVLFDAVISRRDHKGDGRVALETLEMTANNDGNAEIKVPATFDRILVTDVDPQWHFESYTYIRPDHELAASLLINCYPLTKVSFEVYFDDGRPCTSGSIQIVDAKGFRSGERSCTGAPIEVVDVPMTDLLVRVRPLEPGYENVNIPIAASQVFEDAVISIRVPRSKQRKGNVSINLGEDVTQIEQLEVYDQTRYVRQAFVRDRHTEDGQLLLPDLYAGEYFVYGKQGDKVYFTTFSVNDREVTKVNITFTDPATISVRVLGPDGEGVRGAVVRIPFLSYSDYPVRAGNERPGLLTTTTKDGNAELMGVHPEIKNIVIEAEHFQHQIIPVLLAPGETTLIPDVVLQKAIGTVNVLVEGTQSPSEYEVALLDPNGGAGYSTLKTIPPSGRVTFTGVSCRNYLVVVRPVGGGKVVSQLVELSASQPSVDVRLNLRPIEK